MDEQDKLTGVKKRLKVVEVGLDSDENEPIGSLFKLKSKKSGRKCKLGDAEKGKKAADEDEGGMEDTLASFRKKLKGGPKRGSGPVTGDFRSSMSESSGGSFNGLTDDGRLEVGTVSSDMVEVDDDNSSDARMGKKSKIKLDGLVKKSRSISRVKKARDEVKISPTSDDSLDDSLSALLKKAQSSFLKKPKTALSSRTKVEVQASDHLSFLSSDAVPVSVESKVFEESPCDLKFPCPSNIPSSHPFDRGIVSSNCPESDLVVNSDPCVPCHQNSHGKEFFDSVRDLGNRVDIEVCKDVSKEGDESIQPKIPGNLFKKKTYAGNINRVQNGFNPDSNMIYGSDSARDCVKASCPFDKNKPHEDTCELQSQEPQKNTPESVYDLPRHEGTCNDENANSTPTGSLDLTVSGEQVNEIISHSPVGNYDDENPDQADYSYKHRKNSEFAARKTKKRRHGDAVYEDGVDSGGVLHELDSTDNRKGGGTFDRTREKAGNSDIGRAAAVSAGLKAHAVGPMEKIKFKELLKRKGGLQEYLAYRNKILGLWSKDVSRILPLTDCGVSETPAEGETLQASLIRDIYVFLDQSGYINVGIAVKKEKSEQSSAHQYKLLGEKKFEGTSGASITDTADGVSFILGQLRSSQTSGNENVSAQKTIDSSTATKLDVLPPIYELDNNKVGEDTCNRTVGFDSGSLSLSGKGHESGADPVRSSELRDDSRNSSFVSYQAECIDFAQCDSENKRRVIVVGGGPAGLTAARHLQRQGFSVIVLEARSRIGGRVYTDRSSLSVPVDLGASIITGVEADVDTERRPDPSSLICAQLGLELTVLNSDCPLYDIVSGEKVPSDLDKALEAEFNSLLDDMVLLIAQKGNHAADMSLEDGLEYALRRRRMTCPQAENGVPESRSVVANTDPGKDTGRCGTPEIDDIHHKILGPLERRVMDWHFANLEYGCASLLKEVSLPHWNQDDLYGGFGGAHCMIKGGYSAVVESLAQGLPIQLNQVVTDITYNGNSSIDTPFRVKVSTVNNNNYFGDAVLITVPLGCLKAESIKFSPPLPQWKTSAITRLGFGVLNKVILEFSEVFWDDTVDYFGTTSEDTVERGRCFMFWNLKKTVGAPVLIALVVGRAAIVGQEMSSSDHVNHAVAVLRKLFGVDAVPDPLCSVVTDWGRDPFSYGAYSYVAIGSSGEDYDILGRPVDNCLFFAGEATCKEHPDTVGGAMMSGLREAVRLIDICNTGNDYTAEVEALESAQRHSDIGRDEARDISRRLEALQLSDPRFNSLDKAHGLIRETLLKDMFFSAKTSAGRLRLAKELLNLPLESLKSFAGTKEGLTVLNSWILDSMGKDGTQLLRHCVRILVRVSTDLLAVRLSGIGKTVKEKLCVHTSRDIRGIASQLVSMWIEVFRREKASNGGLRLLRHMTSVDSSKSKGKDLSSVKAFTTSQNVTDSKFSRSSKRVNGKQVNRTSAISSRSDFHSASQQFSQAGQNSESEDGTAAMSVEEQEVIAAAEAARIAAEAAAKAYAESEARYNALRQLPKIPSFHKFARRDEYPQVDDSELRKRWSGVFLGKQDCLSEIDCRNFRVRDWSVDFSAACANLDSSRLSVDNLSQKSHSNDMPCQFNLREHSGENTAVDSNPFTRAWVDSAGEIGIKDYHAIERWQFQAAVAESEYHSSMHAREDEDSNAMSAEPTRKHDAVINESSMSQVTVHKESSVDQPRGTDRIKQAIVDYVASLLMPLYKAKKIDRDGYKHIMKKTATKVMEQTTDAEKAMGVPEFLDFKRKNKIRAFVDKLIERHISLKSVEKS